MARPGGGLRPPHPLVLDRNSLAGTLRAAPDFPEVPPSDFPELTGAKDWRSNLAIALDHKGTQHRLQFHHIFPKAVLKSAYSAREADDIANMAFIGGKTNRQISDKAPSLYFPGMVEKSGLAAFHAQCIPTDPSFLEVDKYKAFLQERRVLVSKRLNQFLEA
jgi:hypothetical protein